MAELVRIENGSEESREVLDSDTDDLIDKAEELGVAFGCTDGRCGSCRVEVVSGMDNLSERTQNEMDMGLSSDEPHRLVCQCKISSGVVKVRV